jgi:hypothetical protein
MRRKMKKERRYRRNNIRRKRKWKERRKEQIDNLKRTRRIKKRRERTRRNRRILEGRNEERGG